MQQAIDYIRNAHAWRRDPFVCTNANIGTYGHECGAPARWIGQRPRGGYQAFCDRCRKQGDEARQITTWCAAPQSAA